MDVPLELQVAILGYLGNLDPDTFISLLHDSHFKTVIQEHLKSQILPSITLSSLKGQDLVDLALSCDLHIETIYNIRYPGWKSIWESANRQSKEATHALASIDDEFLSEKIVSSFRDPRDILDSYLSCFYLYLNTDSLTYQEHIQKVHDNFERHQTAHLAFVQRLISKIRATWKNIIANLRSLTPPPIYHLLRSYYPIVEKRWLLGTLRIKYHWCRYNSEYEVIIEELKKD